MSPRIEFHGNVIVDTETGTILLLNKEDNSTCLDVLLTEQLHTHDILEPYDYRTAVDNVHILIWQD